MKSIWYFTLSYDLTGIDDVKFKKWLGCNLVSLGIDEDSIIVPVESTVGFIGIFTFDEKGEFIKKIKLKLNSIKKYCLLNANEKDLYYILHSGMSEYYYKKNPSNIIDAILILIQAMDEDEIKKYLKINSCF